MTRAPTITIRFPATLRGCCNGAKELELSAASVRGALDELERLYPSLHHGLCDETGAVRRHIGVFVDKAHMRDRDGLDTALAPGDIVTFMPAVSGG